jgi:hypothetical protein
MGIGKKHMDDYLASPATLKDPSDFTQQTPIGIVTIISCRHGKDNIHTIHGRSLPFDDDTCAENGTCLFLEQYSQHVEVIHGLMNSPRCSLNNESMMCTKF